MFIDISFSVQGDRILINQNEFPLGEFTAMCMNISPDQYQHLHNLKKAIVDHWPEEKPGVERWTSLHHALCELADALLAIPVLKMIADDKLDKMLREYMTDAENLSADGWRFFCEIAGRYVMIVDDLYAFNMTIFRFISMYLMKLDKLNAEQFATAYFDFLNRPDAYKLIVGAFAGDAAQYSGADFLEMNLMPMKRRDGSFVIAEFYHTQWLQSLLRTDFLKGLMVGHHIRRCLHCDRFFLVTRGYRTKFCGLASPENPRFTCNQMAYRSRRQREEKADDPKYLAYHRCTDRIMRACQRGKISEPQRAVLLRKAEELYHAVATSAAYSDAEFEEMMQSKNLYKRCGIEPPKRGRPKAE